MNPESGEMHWTIIGAKPAYCFVACGVQRFHSQQVCAWDQFCNVPRKKKSIALFHIRIFPSCHFALGNHSMWITRMSQVGHIQIALWVSGSRTWQAQNGTINGMMQGMGKFHRKVYFINLTLFYQCKHWYTTRKSVIIYLKRSCSGVLKWYRSA